MKILFDATELSYFLEKNGHRAGVFFVALNLFRELKKRGIDLVFVCNFKRYYFLKEVLSKVDEFKGIKLLAENSKINKFFAFLNYLVRKMPLKVQYLVLSLSRYYEGLNCKINNKNIFQLKDFDIYFSPFTAPSVEISKSDWIKRFRMIHDIIPILELGGIPKNKRLWCYKIYNDINDKDFYVTNSENTRGDVLKYFPFIDDKNIRNINLGVDENFCKLDTKSDKKYVFSLCTLGKRKNLIFTIRNFFEFIKRNNIKDLYLVLAGGVWKKFEKELVKTIGEFDKSKIILKGYVADEELPKLYSEAIMFVYPSLYEGFGLPVLEAMKCGCPVITSNISSLPEVIGEAGIKINPNNDEEMIKAFEKMYYDNFYRELCIERGLIRAKSFSWEKTTSELLEFIETKCV